MGDGVSNGNRAGDGRGILINNDHQPGVGDRIKPIVASASYQPGVRQTICQPKAARTTRPKATKPAKPAKTSKPAKSKRAPKPKLKKSGATGQ